MRLPSLFAFVFISVVTVIYGLSYDSGSQAIGPNSTVVVSTLTASNISVSTITANAISVSTITGTTFTGGTYSGIVSGSTITVSTMFQIPSNAAPKTNVTPSAVGQIILNTGADPDEVCFSTGTIRSSWTQIRSQTTPCAN